MTNPELVASGQKALATMWTFHDTMISWSAWTVVILALTITIPLAMSAILAIWRFFTS